MDEYLNLVKQTLQEGTFKNNRTDAFTIYNPNFNYKVDLTDGFPLLTTKKMDGFRWNSMVHEMIWYLSGEHHIRDLREKTGIWDEWATEEGYLDTAYGRFWRRFPIPSGVSRLPGESWPDKDHKHVNDEGEFKLFNYILQWLCFTKTAETRKTFDQLGYVLDNLKENPNSRRNVITAWHPANAAVSTLPPCHFTFVFNVENEEILHTHLTQRSADIALGVPFNIASYSLLTHMVAEEVGLEVGEFSHHLVDGHIYCGKGERGKWYKDNLDQVQDILQKEGAQETIEFIENSDIPQENEGTYDHVPGLLKQITREPKEKPKIELDNDSIDDLEYDDIQLKNYSSHDSISFDVLE